MIFVTVGNAKNGYMRLLGAIERFTLEGLFGTDEVLVQHGNNPEFRPVRCKQLGFLDSGTFEENILNAELVICHGGAGTLLHVLRAGKVPVVMPRRQQYGEVIDDHQLELAKALDADGRIALVLEPENLPAAIAKARQLNMIRRPLPSSPMVSLVAQALNELTGQVISNHRNAA